jgi:uncharacterized membrane protein YgcG
MRRRIAFWTAPLLLAWACLAPLARAQAERILDYRSDLTLQSDGTLLVQETIRVYAAGAQIRHGIYRDFPTRYTDYLGNRYAVGFEVTGASRDGAPEPFRAEDLWNGKRVYLGDSRDYVPPGEHTYEISYATNRQLGFFADHDELFWNVTGNGWGFFIEHASATVRLPETIPAGEVRLSGYTGAQGSRAQELTWENQGGVFVFSTERQLPPHSGLSILVSWPKGFIEPPTQQQKLAWFFRDNREALLLSAGLLVLLLYYVLVWSAVGRDPQRGIIMPLYEPPANLSPAAMRYLVRMGFDNKAFSAAILDMAVRGYLAIKQDTDKTYRLFRTNANPSVLTPDERQAAERLFGSNREVWLHNINHAAISGAIAQLKAWLKAAEERIYFFTNSRYLIPGIIASGLMLVAVIVMQGGPKVFIGGFLCVWLTGWSLAVFGLALVAYQKWRAAFTAASGRAALCAGALFVTLFSLPFLAGEALGLFMLVKVTAWFVPVFLVASVCLHALFHFLLKSPTSAGRRLLDQVEGFKLFLGKVDGDRLNRIMPPEQTPQAFEKFLPYALALDVEQAWAEKFSGVLDAAAHSSGGTSPGYTPSFYSGSSWNGFGASGFASSFGSSFTSAISSSAAAPGSSSGGGGSGGGGGGGGGGGW